MKKRGNPQEKMRNNLLSTSVWISSSVLRAPRAILFMSRDFSSDTIMKKKKFFRVCFSGGGGGIAPASGDMLQNGVSHRHILCNVAKCR